MALTKKEKEIKRRSRMRNRQEIDKIYDTVIDNIMSILEKRNRTRRIHFWLYPEYLPENVSILFKPRHDYIIVYFSDIYVHQGIKERLIKEAPSLVEYDLYHFRCKAVDFKQP